MNKVLISGATGLIGQTIVKSLIHSGNEVIAIVRDKKRASDILGDESINLRFLETDISSVKVEEMDIDYVIHGAAQTSSKLFVDMPVETIETAINGTFKMLEIARLSKVKGFLYMSSMEVYGLPQTDIKITEDASTNLDTMAVRSCYPESKRMCENMCKSYFHEYNVPTKVVRLTQTIGPGIKYDDGRIFAEFARCIVEKKDIILHTKGETKRSYLYSEDAANAIMFVMQNGVAGEAYNVANENTYCSIIEMANFVASTFGDNEITIKLNIETRDNFGYAPTLCMNLDTSKLKKLGWSAKTGLHTMYDQLISYMKKEYLKNRSELFFDKEDANY